MEEADLKPHQSVLVKSPDPQFEEKVKDICECYLGALELAEQGERTVCIDEMTGFKPWNASTRTNPCPGQNARV